MVLDNKFNITNQIELNKIEEKLSKEKAKKLFDSGKINQISCAAKIGLNNAIIALGSQSSQL